jgi:hypothetical protein
LQQVELPIPLHGVHASTPFGILSGSASLRLAFGLSRALESREAAGLQRTWASTPAPRAAPARAQASTRCVSPGAATAASRAARSQASSAEASLRAFSRRGLPALSRVLARGCSSSTSIALRGSSGSAHLAAIGPRAVPTWRPSVHARGQKEALAACRVRRVWRRARDRPGRAHDSASWFTNPDSKTNLLPRVKSQLLPSWRYTRHRRAHKRP